MKTLVSQERFASIGFKKSVLKFPEFVIWKNLFAFYKKSCQCSHENGGAILKHCKNILEYPQITRNGTESKNPYNESHSNLLQ